MLLRGRLPRPAVRSSSGEADDGGGPEPRAERRLPRSPVYPSGFGCGWGITSERRKSSRQERLLNFMRDGKYCSVGEILKLMAAEECATAMGELLASGYALDRAGDSFRLRAREDGEPRQLLADVLDGVELTLREDEPEEAEPIVEEEFDPGEDAGVGRVEEVDGLLELSEPPGFFSLSLQEWTSSTRAILAKRGAGKTYLAGVMLEEILPRSERPMVVVVDPGGVFWGLLSTSEGRPSSHEILLLGGPRGHFTLGAKDGVAAANVVCEVRPVPVILDLSELAPIEQHELVADFCERMWAREHFPLHVVVDEADEFAPQRFGALPRYQRRSLDLLGRMVMRGRGRGMGATLISLRPAVMSKNLLSQVDELYLLRLMEANDIRAASVWLENFDHQVSERQRVACLSQLPVLPTGISYFLRGGDNPTFRRFKVREKRTYDSSRTLGSGARGNPVLSSPGPEVLVAARKILENGDDSTGGQE